MTIEPFCSCCCMGCIEGRHCGGSENDHGVCMWPVDDYEEEYPIDDPEEWEEYMLGDYSLSESDSDDQ